MQGIEDTVIAMATSGMEEGDQIIATHTLGSPPQEYLCNGPGNRVVKRIVNLGVWFNDLTCHEGLRFISSLYQ